MEKRLIIAITLSIVIIFTFQYYLVPQQKHAPQETVAQKVTPAVHQEEVKDTKRLKIIEDSELIIESKKYVLTFTDLGGAIKRIQLKDYPDSMGRPSELVDAGYTDEPLFTIKDIRYNSVNLGACGTYKLNKNNSSTQYLFSDEHVDIEKEYNIHDDSNYISLRLTIRNKKNAEALLSFPVIAASNITEKEQADQRYVECVASIDGTVIKYKNPGKKSISQRGIVSWVALKNKYFSIILKPSIEAQSYTYYKNSGGALVATLAYDNIKLPANGEIIIDCMLYVGPSKLTIIKKFGDEFTGAVDYGIFGFIAKALLAIMATLFNITKSWGLSIIILSIIVNIVLFPLTMKSFSSMKRMQELSPQIEKLKKQHADNPQRMNKEMLELYKTYKINPMSGCLPLVLQMPVFIALYNSLARSIDLKGAKFLWVQDLSLPDNVYLPVELPFIGNAIHVLPIVMIVAMVIQQKLSSAANAATLTDEQKQQQKMMLFMMPVMFGFIFYGMPSGLVLYWVVSTVLSSTEQYFIFKKT